MDNHHRKRVGSVKNELLRKSREAALAAVQVFNNPLIHFKSEMFIVNMHIAYTYLLHAYYRDKGIEYRHVNEVFPSGRRRFGKTKYGAHKHLSLQDCLDLPECPLDKDTDNNLRFLIGLRHEIEHQMTDRIDDALSARFQACCLNYNDAIKKLFGDAHGIDKYLSFSLQFSSLSDSQVSTLASYANILPPHVSRFVEGFDGSLTDDEYNSQKYAYRVIFTPKTANRQGQADKVIEFVPAGSDLAKNLNITYASIKEREKTKYTPKTIVETMQSEGFTSFTMKDHINLWKKLDAKQASKSYGVQLDNRFYWYENWIGIVRKHCADNRSKYS